MSSKSVVYRNKHRKELNLKYAAKIADVKAKLHDARLGRLEISDEEMAALEATLQQIPRNAHRVRQRNRCALSGRPRAFLRRYGLCRHMFRLLANQGMIPGVCKSSW